MDEMQQLQVEIQFSPTATGGRTTAVNLKGGTYRPHLTTGSNRLLGVAFVDAIPEIAKPGDKAVATIALMYPGVDYSSLTPSVVFRVLEGSQVVATGTVLSTYQR